MDQAPVGYILTERGMMTQLPTACEVLVRVIGSSVNPADRGAPSGPSVVMGADIAGRVVATNGVNCSRVYQGDAVWADIGAYATPRSGGSAKELGAYGEYAVALETQLGLKPTNASPQAIRGCV